MRPSASKPCSKGRVLTMSLSAEEMVGGIKKAWPTARVVAARAKGVYIMVVVLMKKTVDDFFCFLMDLLMDGSG